MMPGICPDFHQEGPRLGNTYENDAWLKAFLAWRMPGEVLKTIEPDLQNFGGRCASDVLELALQAEAQPPKLVSFDPWGRRIDEIEVSPAWRALDAIAATEGLIAIGYERKQKQHSRLYQFAKLYLFHPSSAFYSCPLAMTDGAARVIELSEDKVLKERAFLNLTSRDPAEFWTSGQWMTERTGGSDVSGTSTIARIEADTYRLTGDKWFTSATTSQMTMALAKVEGATDSREGLSLFYVELRDSSGKLDRIRIHRLKDKLGTKALPTAELRLDGTAARMIGGVGEGVKRVSALLNVTRLYNAVCSIATIARGLTLAKDYAHKREAFGAKLIDQPLHLATLVDIQVEFEAVAHLTFHAVELLGKDETGIASEDEKVLLRLFTPLAKLWSAKQAIALTSEVIECFGGAGYIEDTGLPKLLRDAQVFSIWEGTTNVLSLDVLRVIEKEKALTPYFIDVEKRLSLVKSAELAIEVAKVREAVTELQTFAMSMSQASLETRQGGARSFALGLSKVMAASLLLDFADWNQTAKKRDNATEVARRFIAKGLVKSSQVGEMEMTKLRAALGS